jgi:hypothetical protein
VHREPDERSGTVGCSALPEGAIEFHLQRFQPRHPMMVPPMTQTGVISAGMMDTFSFVACSDYVEAEFIVVRNAHVRPGKPYLAEPAPNGRISLYG